MSNTFKIKSPLSTGASVDLDDTINTKEALRNLGYYKLPDYGLTPYPDQALFDGIKRVQRRYHLPETGEIRPGDATEGAVRFALAEKARSKTDGQKRDGQKREGKYIWRTRGDAKVRSEHAERNGQTYDWNNPPEGGHPGEAPNCRCRAEKVNLDSCEHLRLQLEVDGNNLDAARTVWEKAKVEVEKIDQELAEVRLKKEKIVAEVRDLYPQFGEAMLRGKVPFDASARLSALLAEYADLEIKFSTLADERKRAVEEREFKRRDKDEANAVFRVTLDKLKRQDCIK